MCKLFLKEGNWNYLILCFYSKPKTKRGKRFLEGREPKVNENVKKAMFVNGGRTNEVVRTALKQFVNSLK